MGMTQQFSNDDQLESGAGPSDLNNTTSLHKRRFPIHP